MGRDAPLLLIRGKTRGPAAALARLALGAAAGPYGVAVRLRNLAFDRGWRPVERAGVPVVSVGNLTVGGTGKTPTVEWVARRFRSRGRRVALLSRGYGQSQGLNDEGLVLDQNLPDVPHLQDADRVRLARIAVEELEAEVLVLDDGFQHRRLGRDLDLVLLDALDPFGLGRLLPRGLLREPIGSLRRAGVVLLSRADLVDAPTRRAIRARAERAAGPLRWAEARHAPRDLIDAEGESSPLDGLAGRKVAAFCGIGNPEGFRRTLAQLGVAPIGFRAFPDHHPYPRADVEDLARWAAGLGADLALTTQKDSVKLRVPALGPVPLRALRIGLELLEGYDALDAALAAVLPPGSPGP
jgi:tetraacyldisaccharide 4'-kinase